jgi:hypothetical protein
MEPFYETIKLQELAASKEFNDSGHNWQLIQLHARRNIQTRRKCIRNWARVTSKQ